MTPEQINDTAVAILKRNKRKGSYKPMSIETLIKRLGGEDVISWRDAVTHFRSNGHRNIRLGSMDHRATTMAPCYRTDEEYEAAKKKYRQVKELKRSLHLLVTGLYPDAHYERHMYAHTFTMEGHTLRFYINSGVTEGLDDGSIVQVALANVGVGDSIKLGALDTEAGVKRARLVIKTSIDLAIAKSMPMD